MREQTYVSLNELFEALPAAPPSSVPSIELPVSPLVTSEEIHHQDIVIGQHEPVLTDEQILGQVGVELGELAAVIELPSYETEPWIPEYYRPPEAIYCFREPARGKHQRHGYILATKDQLALIKQSHAAGEADLAEVMQGIIRLEPGQESHRIGRAHWLPAVGVRVALVHDNPDLKSRYETISHQHAELYVDSAGALHLADTSLNGTIVRENR